MFPEAAMPSSAELQSFATKFQLPAFHVTVVSDPDAWGSAVTTTSNYYQLYATEAALDLEVVHGLAPGAKEVVYESSMGQEIPGLLKAMVTQRPTAILSSSWGMDNCAADIGDKQNALAENAVFEMAAAQGTSIMWATGDRGAYSCLYDGDPATASELSVPSDDNSPYITDVGGTLAFLSTTGAYYREAAWGEPMEQWGGTGGFSAYFSRPVWQYGLGLAGVKERGIPDVSADADSNSGWDVFAPGRKDEPVQEPIGGTSAAAPCWAAVTALIDEFLAHQHLPSVGFADPAFYYFASSPKGLPAPAFHDVTEGTNLYYPATPGWDAATGLGSPDVAHLADDFEWYYRTHHNRTT
jgi:kumamolisin